MKQLTFAVLVIFSAISCKKETTQYSATGLWYGNIYVVNCALVNRPNGSCRLFEEVPVKDTATAKVKFDGTYIVTGNKYRAELTNENDLITIIECDFIANDKMTGRMVSGSSNFDFSMKKEP